MTLRPCVAIALGLLVAGCEPTGADPGRTAPAAGAWSESQLALLESLRIAAFPPAPPDPSNRVADTPSSTAI